MEPPKKKMKSVILNIFIISSLSSLLMLPSTAQATLISRLDGQAVYDTDFNITWMADAGLAQSQGYGNYGMSWYVAEQWIASLNAMNYLGFSDWRLPETLQPDPTCDTQWNSYWGSKSGGLGCTLSELGHLFYDELGGVVLESIHDTHNQNYDLFRNIGYNYWSGTPYEVPVNLYVNYGMSYFAWHFQTSNGGQFADGKYNDYFFNAWAVRDGDVAAVPEPSVLYLLAIGFLSAALGLRSKRSRTPAFSRHSPH